MNNYRPLVSLRKTISQILTPIILSLGMGVGYAELPAPDNLIYGRILINSQLISAFDTSYSIEASKTPGGAVIDSYKMGNNPDIGNFYQLKIKVDELPLFPTPDSSLVGETLYITLRNGTQAVATGQALLHVIPERGNVRQLDIIVGDVLIADVDLDGLPDVWESFYFGPGGANPEEDSDGDGISNGGEFEAGTEPDNNGSFFRLFITNTGSGSEVSFVAVGTDGLGEEGLARLYTLEQNSALLGGDWTPVPGFEDLLGGNEVIVFQTVATGSDPLFFRAAVTLE